MYYYPHDMRQHYSATPSGYSSSMSSGVSTPAMTPPFAPVMDTMLSHCPSWMMATGENNPLLVQVQNLQAQTAQLALMIKEQHPPITQRFHVPMYMTPPSPAPPVAGNYSDALHAAQSVLNSVPANQQLEESVLAKAVVAAANALLLAGGARTGHISALRVPTAVRPLDPDSSLVFANYKRNPSSESPAPSDRGSKCNSPLLRDGVPMFGLEPKSPGTVTKCARQDE